MKILALLYTYILLFNASYSKQHDLVKIPHWLYLLPQDWKSISNSTHSAQFNLRQWVLKRDRLLQNLFVVFVRFSFKKTHFVLQVIWARSERRLARAFLKHYAHNFSIPVWCVSQSACNRVQGLVSYTFFLPLPWLFATLPQPSTVFNLHAPKKIGRSTSWILTSLFYANFPQCEK